MEKQTRKIKIHSVLLLAILTISSIAVFLSSAIAQETPTMQSYPFIGAVPNPVQVNQMLLFHVGISQQLSSTAMGWTDLSITIERPDGETDTITDIRTDSTGGTGVVYVPPVVGTYTAQLHFPDQEITSDRTTPGLPVGGIMLGSDSEVIEFVVQDDPINYYPGQPLPDEYWTRPVNGQLYEWSNILGDWVKPAGSYYMPPIAKYHAGNADFPETAHILWTKVYTQGGLGNAELGNVQYEMGDAYEYKFIGSVILSGVLYYNAYEARGTNPELEQQVVAVDIKTGEELWRKTLGNNERLAYGQSFHWDSYNYHGIFGYLWTATPDNSAGFAPLNVPQTLKAYDPQSGRWEYTIENVPPGETIYGPKGEMYRYTVNLRNGWMTLWNSSRTVSVSGSWRPQGNTYDAANGIEWNVTIPTDLPGSVAMTFFNDRIHGSQANSLFGWSQQDVTSWAIDVSPSNEGDLIFKKTFTMPEAGLTLVWCDAMLEDNRFIISAKENRRYYAFDLTTGDLVWTSEPEQYLAFYDKWYGPAYGYGKFFTGRVSGIVTCYDLETGNVDWTYNVADNLAEVTWSNNFPIEYHFLADGKICLSYGEHSPINPLPRGGPMVVLDVETGEKIWEISWVNNWWGGHTLIGDSTIVGLNGYDNRIYSIGKGPSEITVESPLMGLALGSSVTLRGRVTDISPGTQDYAISARFPNGVPVVADEDMTEWMEYVYMQFGRPANVNGVPVKIEIVDPNGEYAWIGTATTDVYGNYGYSFRPQVEGQYMIIATFEGSASYFGSTSTTYFTVDPAPTPAAPIEPEEPETPVAPIEPTQPEAPLITTEIAIIIAVAVVAVIGVAAYWMLKRK
ncbi:MAG: PQQ-binding-like beta-propeller repeat protein [Candidatus Bathyarchaeota archaeon]|nr:MAG: PQQ-binding-like beta-propeller repeat protein [Candidatus Bathyarchaeota archaeon]